MKTSKPRIQWVILHPEYGIFGRIFDTRKECVGYYDDSWRQYATKIEIRVVERKKGKR
jgi:hypothetical protein